MTQVTRTLSGHTGTSGIQSHSCSSLFADGIRIVFTVEQHSNRLLRHYVWRDSGETLFTEANTGQPARTLDDLNERSAVNTASQLIRCLWFGWQDSAESGHSIRLDRLPLPSAGYIVSDPYYGLQFSTDCEFDTFRRRTFPIVRDYLRNRTYLIVRQKAECRNAADVVLGLWTDSETLITHFDISYVIEPRERALRLGTVWGQVAVWDCANSCEIRIS
jgi:hypothetical protein